MERHGNDSASGVVVAWWLAWMEWWLVWRWSGVRVSPTIHDHTYECACRRCLRLLELVFVRVCLHGRLLFSELFRQFNLLFSFIDTGYWLLELVESAPRQHRGYSLTE